MAAGQELENMKNESTCSICLDFYKDPVTVECQHLFCRACILQHWEKAEGTVLCPQCRQQFAHQTVRPNRFAASVVESVRRLVEGHRQREGGSRCPEHDERLKLFCENDQRAICLVCAMSQSHKDHIIRPLKEAAELYKEKLQRAMDSLREQLEEIRIAKDEDTANLKVLKKKAGSLRVGIEAEFEKLHQFLSNEKLALITKLEEKEKVITQQIEENVKKLLDESASINQEIIDIQKRQSMQEMELLLQNVTPITERSGAETGHARSVSVDLTLEEFTGPLDYEVWKRMLKILSPAALTLNPLTANRCLSVFDNRTQVISRDTQIIVLDNPERFKYWPSVLASEGFTSGRHYWEVEVGNNTDWRLGVVIQSVPRKENSRREPATGFWTIKKHVFNKYYKVMTSPPTTLAPKVRFMKLGIYLDYEGGQVSFYNADDMSHLYTFTDTFTEKLYPIFSTGCNHHPLKLITIKNS